MKKNKIPQVGDIIPFKVTPEIILEGRKNILNVNSCTGAIALYVALKDHFGLSDNISFVSKWGATEGRFYFLKISRKGILFNEIDVSAHKTDDPDSELINMMKLKEPTLVYFHFTFQYQL